MFSRKKKEKEQPVQAELPKAAPARKSGTGIPSIISADLRILGNIVSDGIVDLDGIVEGNVKCHTVTVRKNGHIKGDVIAEAVHVYGRIQGLIKARSVHFFKGCRAEGVIMHESITIEDGAFVDGRFKRTEDLSLDEGDATADAATLPADEPKKLFGPGSAGFDDSEFKAPSFLSATEEAPATALDDEAEGEGEANGTGIKRKGLKGNKREKQESVMDNLRLISDIN